MQDEIVDLVEVTNHTACPHHCVVQFNHTRSTYDVTVETSDRREMAKFIGLPEREMAKCVRENSTIPPVFCVAVPAKERNP